MDGVIALDELWPPFMLQDICAKLIDSDVRLLDWVFAVVADGDETDEVLGRALSIPLRWDSDDERFPERGWDAAIVDSVRCFQQELEPNTMCLLEVTLRPSLRGSDASRTCLQAVKDIARQRGLEAVVVPVRPFGKSRRQDLTMEQYIDLRDRDGLPIDSWLRLHIEAGGRVAGVAPMSMIVAGTYANWAKWTGLDMHDHTDRVTVPEALAPVVLHAQEDIAIYVEPNVWVEHDLRLL